jgi:SAM-dependent methyltransferase
MSACAVCGTGECEAVFQASDRLYHTTNERFSVVRCRSCGLLRLDPQPDADALGRYYPGNYWFAPDESAAGKWEERYRRLVLRDHVRFVRRALGESRARGQLLDAGCGGGLFLGMMREGGYRVLGLDISREAASMAWRRQSVPAVCAALEAAPFAAGSLAGLTLFHVLEHLADPCAYLRAAHELLAPDGRLIVQVPNAASWQCRLLGRRWNGMDVPRHLWDFRASDVAMLMERCGFEVVRKKYFSLRDNPAGLASSLAPGLDPMARRVRRVAEGRRARLAKDAVYLALVAAALPFTLIEAACGAGATVTIEGRRV